MKLPFATRCIVAIARRWSSRRRADLAARLLSLDLPGRTEDQVVQFVWGKPQSPQLIVLIATGVYADIVPTVIATAAGYGDECFDGLIVRQELK